MAAMMGAVLGWLAGSRWALAAARWGAVGLTVLLFLLSVRRTGERAGRMAQRLETLEKSNDVQRRMPEADIARVLGIDRRRCESTAATSSTPGTSAAPATAGHLDELHSRRRDRSIKPSITGGTWPVSPTHCSLSAARFRTASLA